MNSLHQFAAAIGIDWADKKHDLCLRVRGSESLEFSVLKHAPDIIEDWANALRDRFPGQRVAVCLESRKVPLIHALLKYDFLVLFPVNPQTLARYRRALRPSRAKDDPTDAELILDLVQRHPEHFKPWKPERPEIRALAQLVELRRRLVADKVRYTNRLTACLKNYYPQALQWFTDIDTLVFCQFIERWPTLQKAQRAREESLRRFFAEHNSRYPDVINRRLKAIRSATSLTDDPGVIEPNRMMVDALVHQLALVLGHIRRFDVEIAKRFAKLDDATLFKSLPGAGQHLAPRLLVVFGEDRSRFTSADSVSQYTGVAPVTERSGNKSWVHWRYCCAKFLRQSLIELTNETIRFSFWAKAFYQQQRQHGKTHQMAIRSLAFKWIRILWRCWQDRMPYDEAKYLLILQAKGSSLLIS